MSDAGTSWEELSDRWREADPPARSVEEDLASFASVLRRRRLFGGLVIVGEAVVTFLLGWLTLTLWRASPTGVDLAFLAVLWTIWAIATGFAWWNRRGQWSWTATDTTQFATLSLEHARRRVRVARFSLALLLAQLGAAVTAWVGGVGFMRGGFSSFSVLVGWLGATALVYLAWIVWYHRRAKTEEQHFRRLLRELES